MSHGVIRRLVAIFLLFGLKVESKFSRDIIQVDTSRWVCPYHVLKTSTLISCIDICVSYTDCEAVNYNTKTTLCELFIPTADPYELSYGAKNRIYVNMTIINQLKGGKPCYGRPCAPGERCIPDRGHTICETPDNCPSLYLVTGPCGVTSSKIVASSGIVAKGFRLDSKNDWCAEYQQPNESILVEFRSEKIIKEVVTQGSGNKRKEVAWVEAYTMEYSLDCHKFRYVLSPDRKMMVRDDIGSVIKDQFHINNDMLSCSNQ